MAFCGNCGAETADDGVCPNCGPAVAQAADVDQPQQQAQYEQPPQQVQQAPGGRPMRQLKTDRGLLKLILLSIVTLGIYGIIFYYSISSDINEVATRYDGKKTMNYALLLLLVGPATLGIGYFVWFHRAFNRIGDEMRRRGINTDFGASVFWIWGVLGGLIIVGPFIEIHKLCTAMNELNANYNQNG